MMNMYKSGYINRVLDIAELLKIQSLFLFGARQTGKTSYILNQLEDDIVMHVDLLDTSRQSSYIRNPGLLASEIRALDRNEGLIVIDEIQLVPVLLNEVHRIMESSSFSFLLTGSGVRRLMHAGVDLLGGRAGQIIFHPLVWPEIKDKDYSLEHIFSSGLLPRMYLSGNSGRLLSSYCGSFLINQVQSEGLVRNMPAFSDFLTVAALSSGQQLNFANIASDTGMSVNSIKAWYGILSDMLVGYEIPAFTSSIKRKATAISKYYIFDVGVLRSLMSISPPEENSGQFGNFFEHYICHELVSYIDYHGAMPHDRGLCYWRSRSGYEVDFVFRNQVAIEVKTTRSVDERKDLKGLRALMEEGIFEKFIIVSREERKRRTEDGIWIYPFKDFLDELWSGKILPEQMLS